LVVVALPLLVVLDLLEPMELTQYLAHSLLLAAVLAVVKQLLVVVVVVVVADQTLLVKEQQVKEITVAYLVMRYMASTLVEVVAVRVRPVAPAS
jgi:hypothetical protein